jgi:Carboxypeptidase regulatory-like domain/TonB-dependent Receptor Plug Domain
LLKHSRIHLSNILFAAFFASCALQAQDATGRIVGVVTDPQKSSIVGAKVTITEVETKVIRTTTTAGDGAYQVLQLPIGIYSVTAEQTGFAKVVMQPQPLRINQALRVDISMQVGQVSDTVSVEADASGVETVVSGLGSTVTQKTISSLPLNGRNTLDLALLQPGVTASNSGATAGSGTTFNVAGGRSDSVTYLLDGGINNNLLSNGVVFQPNPDAVNEFKILTSNYGAEYGRNGGGIVSEVIKSGTNQIHGSAYDYVRNQAFNANTFFNNASSIPVPILKRNQFGATIGGPVVIPKVINGRNKLFFFVTYQGQRQVSTTVNAAVAVYTPAELQGNFSKSNTAKNGPDTKVVSFLQKYPFFQPDPSLAAQGIIDPSKINTVSANYIKAGLVPSAASGQVIPQGNASANSDDLIEKIDYSPSVNDRVAVTLSSGRAPTLNPFGTSNVPGYPTTTTLRRYHGVADYTHIFSPNVINDIRFTAQRNNSLQSAPAATLPVSKALGINIISDNPTGPTDVSFSSGATIGFSVQGPTALIDNTYDLSDVLTWTKGKHTMKYGFTVQPYQDNTNYDFYINGEFFFSGSSGIGSGNDRADFLFGLPDEYLQFGAAPSNIRSKYYAGFFQDEWRVRSNLTLTLGLRYEYSSPKRDLQARSFSLKYGQQSVIFPGAPKGLLFPYDPGAPTGANFPDKNNFAPRFGFAYSPGASHKTSIRGGFGVFYDILKGEDNLQFNGQAPFYGFADLFFDPLSKNPTAPVNYMPNPFVAAGAPNPFPSTPPPHNIDFGASGNLPIGGGGVYYVNPNLRTPYVYQYNLSLQRQLTNSLILETSYVGSSSHKLTGLVDSNSMVLGTSTRYYGTQPGANNADYSYLDTFDNVGRAHYNSLEAGLSKRFSRTPYFGDSQFQLSYTYQHSIDNESGFRETTSRVPFYNQKQFVASSDYDLRHNIVFSGEWDLPFAQAWQSGPKRLTRGWSLFPIISYRTGFPLDISAGISRTRTRIGPSGDGDPNLVRANLLTANVPLFDPRNKQVINSKTGSYYFSPLDFGTFADINTNQNTYGTLGRNAIYGPGRFNADFSIVKVTPVSRERVTFEVRADFFNILNHAEFANPNLSITSGTFGQITSTAGPRIIQLAGHLVF